MCRTSDLTLSFTSWKAPWCHCGWPGSLRKACGFDSDRRRRIRNRQQRASKRSRESDLISPSLCSLSIERIQNPRFRIKTLALRAEREGRELMDQSTSVDESLIRYDTTKRIIYWAVEILGFARVSVCLWASEQLVLRAGPTVRTITCDVISICSVCEPTVGKPH